MLLSIFKCLMLASTAYLVTGCEQSVAELHSADLPIEYVSVSTELIEDGMVRIRVDVRHAKQDAAVFYFANCAAARYAINGGFSFLLHVISTLDYKQDLKSAEAVYLISATLPPGSKKLDAEVVAINCAENGIPMV